MKWIVAGSRTFNDQKCIFCLLDNYKALLGAPEEVITGGAKGVDEIGKKWAIKNNIKNKEFKADWDQYGKSAGPIRNKQMADYVSASDALMLFWDGKSKGSANMKKTAEEKDITIFDNVLNIQNQE